jgi:hypothetical protein
VGAAEDSCLAELPSHGDNILPNLRSQKAEHPIGIVPPHQERDEVAHRHHHGDRRPGLGSDSLDAPADFHAVANRAPHRRQRFQGRAARPSSAWHRFSADFRRLPIFRAIDLG